MLETVLFFIVSVKSALKLSKSSRAANQAGGERACRPSALTEVWSNLFAILNHCLMPVTEAQETYTRNWYQKNW